MESRPRRPRRSFGFPTTRWTLVLTLRSTDPTEVRRALEELVTAYRAPLLAYLRCLRVDVSDVQDSLHDFLINAIDKHTLERADPALGRFRSFLKACLGNFVADQRDIVKAKKRGGDVPHVGLEPLENGTVSPADARGVPTPAELFDRVWAATVLHRAVEEVAQDYARRKRTPIFEALIRTATADDSSIPYDEIAMALGFNQGSIRVEVHRLRRRLAARVRAVIADTVLIPDDVERELRFLRSALTPRGAARRT